ncbi:acyltransferase [Methylobacterium sp. J-026]|uniref:acyltransferase family protein n=1 Tax=Methylobacterium sp. J-026 TaxID=2836624 RepID=UPI001FB863CC|nr:acyltransferase family protein [Methylobacterium sp. J-026]MCJ2134545.1 acyltransferase [Methylobacterium sp. J-026]
MPQAVDTIRDTHLDAARGVGIFLVICGHLLEPTFLENGSITAGPAFALWRIIYAFHMPFFFLVCGMTDRIIGLKRSSSESAVFLEFVFTAIVFSIIAYIPQFLLGNISISDVLLCHILGQRLGLAPLWFLIALAMVRFTYSLASKMVDGVAFWVVIAVFLALSIFSANSQYKVWYFQSIFGALPFYVFGRLMIADFLKVRVISGLCGLLILLACSSRNFVHLAAGEYGDIGFFAASALGGCCFALAVISSMHGVALSVSVYLGRHSFELFIMSGIVLTASPMMREMDNAAGIFLILLLGVPVQITLARLLRRPIIAIRRAVQIAIEVGRQHTSAPARV